MSSERNTVARGMHDLGLAAWFGGSLMGAVGLNGAASQSDSLIRATRIAGSGWDRWAPLNTAAIGAHLVGNVGLLKANRTRVAHQEGVAASSAVKSAVTGAALGATWYARVLGKRLETTADADLDGSAAPEDRPEALEATARKLRLVQWTIPALTGVLVVLNALHGEQQRPSQQKLGYLRKAATRVGAHV